MPKPATQSRIKPLEKAPPARAAALRVWSESELDEVCAMLSEVEAGVSDSRNYAKSGQARAAARTLQRALVRYRDIKTSSRVWFDTKTRRWRWALTLRKD